MVPIHLLANLGFLFARQYMSTQAIIVWQAINIIWSISALGGSGGLQQAGKDELYSRSMEKIYSLMPGVGAQAAALTEITLYIRDQEIKKMSSPISNSVKREALTECAQIFMNSQRVSYLLRRDSEGKQLPENPEWYSVMKGGSPPLYGPNSDKIMGGRLQKNWKFKNVNTKHMQDSMTYELDVTFFNSKVTISFPRDVMERAEINEYGLESKMVLINRSSGKELEYDIKVQPRSVLGIADSWMRLGMKTDDVYFEETWERVIDDHLKG